MCFFHFSPTLDLCRLGRRIVIPMDPTGVNANWCLGASAPMVWERDIRWVMLSLRHSQAGS